MGLHPHPVVTTELYPKTKNYASYSSPGGQSLLLLWPHFVCPCLLWWMKIAMSLSSQWKQVKLTNQRRKWSLNRPFKTHIMPLTIPFVYSWTDLDRNGAFHLWWVPGGYLQEEEARKNPRCYTDLFAAETNSCHAPADKTTRLCYRIRDTANLKKPRRANRSAQPVACRDAVSEGGRKR